MSVYKYMGVYINTQELHEVSTFFSANGTSRNVVSYLIILSQGKGLLVPFPVHTWLLVSALNCFDHLNRFQSFYFTTLLANLLVCISMYVSVCMYQCVRISMYVHASVCISLYEYIWVCTYACICMGIYIYIYIYIYMKISFVSLPPARFLRRPSLAKHTPYPH